VRTLRTRTRAILRELNDLIVAGRAGRCLLFGALLIVGDAAFYKRCGCDKEILRHTFDGGPFTIAGRTFDFESGVGVPGVQLTFDGPEVDYSILTGANGNFSLSGVEPGTYQVKTWLDGFDERMKEIVIDRSTGSFNIPLAQIHQSPLLIRDTWVSLEDPINNYEDMDYFRIGRKSGPGSQFQSLLKLSAPAMTWGSHVIQARMTGWAFSEMFDSDSPQVLCNIMQDFDPSEVNWLNRPNIGNLSLGTLIDVADSGPPWKIEWDVTDILEAYRDPSPAEPTFGVNWTIDSPAGASIGSTDCTGPSCGGALTGTVTWAANPPDFP